MAYDEHLADRVRHALRDDGELTERKMFGGLAFLSRGHMVCGVVHEALMVRLGAEQADAALDQPHVRPMDFTGRPMRGMVFVDPPALTSDAALAAWVGEALAFVAKLPPKVRSAAHFPGGGVTDGRESGRAGR
jgi:TfoX/Sxy family transcriptional regulator of competence genes